MTVLGLVHNKKLRGCSLIVRVAWMALDVVGSGGDFGLVKRKRARTERVLAD